MENALNVFGAAEYNLPEMKVQQAKNSDRIIAETLQYRDTIQGLITGSYPRMLGAVMALENHADKMLTVFREAFDSITKTLIQVNSLRKLRSISTPISKMASKIVMLKMLNSVSITTVITKKTLMRLSLVQMKH